MHSNNISSEIHIIISCENVNNERDDYISTARHPLECFYCSMYKCTNIRRVLSLPLDITKISFDDTAVVYEVAIRDD